MKGLGSLYTHRSQSQGPEKRRRARWGCRQCWLPGAVGAVLRGNRVTASSQGAGREEERSCFVIRREMSTALKIRNFLASGSFGTELGAGCRGRGRAGFLQSEPFPVCPTGLAGVRGRGQFCLLVLSSVGSIVLSGTSLCSGGQGWGGGEVGKRAEESITSDFLGP